MIRARGNTLILADARTAQMSLLLDANAIRAMGMRIMAMCRLLMTVT